MKPRGSSAFSPCLQPHSAAYELHIIAFCSFIVASSRRWDSCKFPVLIFELFHCREAFPCKTSRELIYRQFHYGPGAIIGITDWFLERPRACYAYAESDCTMYSIKKQAFDKLSHEAPEAVLALVTIIARMAILNELHVGEYLERANASVWGFVHDIQVHTSN